MLPESRFQSVLDEFLMRARAGGERSITLARLVLASTLVLRMLVVGPPLKHGAPRDWILVGVLLLVMGVSVFVDRRVRSVSRGRHTVIIGLSVLSDAFCVLVALVALALWPYEGYAGLTRAPSFAFVIIAVVGSALRFSLPLVVTSVTVNGLALAGLLAYESYGAPSRPLVLEELLTVCILFASASTLAFALVIRGRKQISQGARALHRAEHAARTLGAYISSEVAEEALTERGLRLGGVRQPVVCLFTDLRGFTSYSETLPPEQLVTELNAYFDAMVSVVRGEGGIVDKFIGDAIMVVFGVPRSKGDEAVRAIRTARGMQRALAKHNVARGEQGLPALVQGIGVHAGPAVVGNIGTAERLQYTVMGSVVNVASRLEAATKEAGAAVIISAATVEAVRACGAEMPELRPLPPLKIRGLREPLAAFCFPDDGFSRQHMLPEMGASSES